jgi:hypothetical protein
VLCVCMCMWGGGREDKGEGAGGRTREREGESNFTAYWPRKLIRAQSIRISWERGGEGGGGRRESEAPSTFGKK